MEYIMRIQTREAIMQPKKMTKIEAVTHLYNVESHQRSVNDLDMASVTHCPTTLIPRNLR